MHVYCDAATDANEKKKQNKYKQSSGEGVKTLYSTRVMFNAMDVKLRINANNSENQDTYVRIIHHGRT